jgi:molybdate transport system substrate-binding protein
MCTSKLLPLRRVVYLLLAVTSLSVSSVVIAGEINVAVASNFVNPFKQIAEIFFRQTSHTVNVSSGSTGKLYAQIINGAPFDILYAANAEEPIRLEQEGWAISGSRYTYAIGRLALWSYEPQRIDSECAIILRRNDYAKLAIANPDTAPYGREAVRALRNLEVYSQLKNKLIIGSNIGQVFQYIVSRNVEMGIVSLSQVIDPNNTIAGSYCLLSQSLYQPLIQQVVRLKHSEDNPAVIELLEFMKTAEVRKIILQYGYTLD